MAYLAIARKWRPQRFEDVVGQGHVTRTLQNAISLGRVHHAFLFTGARGVGKTTAARILAKCLTCETGPTTTPCNECRNCKEVTAGIANDVQEIDAASNTGVDSVRDLRDRLRYLPSSSKFKIYIIDEVHMLSTSAFNALLKTLEEPPAHVIFIFATTDPQKVPDTILSRCQRFDFKRIPLRQIAEKLSSIARDEGVEVSESAILLVAREADGSMRDAQSLLDQVLASATGAVDEDKVVEVLGLIDRRLIFDCLSGLLRHEATPALEAVERVYGVGFDLRQFGRELLEVIRHLNVVKVSKEAERFVDVSGEELTQLKGLAAQSSTEELSRLFAIMLEGLDQVSRSENPRLALEMTLLRMSQVRPVKSVDELLQKLAHLEGALRAGQIGARGASVPPPQDRTPPSLAMPAASPGAPGGRPPLGRPGVPEARPGIPSRAPGQPEPRAGIPSGPPGFQRPGPAPVDQGRSPRTASPPASPEESDDEDGPPSPADSGPSFTSVQTPAPDRPASSAPATPDRGSERWLKGLEQVYAHPEAREKARFLREASCQKMDRDSFVLGVRSQLMVSQVEKELQDPQVRAWLTEAFSGMPVLQCVWVGPDGTTGESFRDREEAKERARVQGVQSTELEHPRVKTALQVFGITAAEIRVELERARTTP